MIKFSTEQIPAKSTYEGNDLDLESVRRLMHELNKAWDIAALGGMNPDHKHGDTDEADAISRVMSLIRKKYQGRATKEQRGEWN